MPPSSSRYLLLSRLIAALTLLLLATGCGARLPLPQRPLTAEEIQQRSTEYFNRGMDAYQKAEWRRALDNFRMARAYDLQNLNPQISEMLEKTETRMRGGNVVLAMATPVPGAAPTPNVGTSVVFKTYRSKLYPYSVDLPETWSVEPAAARVIDSPADLLRAPKENGRSATLTVAAHALPDNADLRRAYLEAHRKLLWSQGVFPDEAGKRLVDGIEATLLRNSGLDTEGKYVEVRAIFATNEVGWALIFKTSADDNGRLMPLFHKLLDSFRLVNSTSV